MTGIAYTKGKRDYSHIANVGICILCTVYIQVVVCWGLVLGVPTDTTSHTK